MPQMATKKKSTATASAKFQYSMFSHSNVLPLPFLLQYYELITVQQRFLQRLLYTGQQRLTVKTTPPK